jgi:muramoyltetrapeptide carboxypeptidase
MSIIIPKYLKEGSRIGICCPASKMSMEVVQPMIAQLEFWGFEVVLGNTVGTAFNNFSGTDKERLTDFQQMLDDDSIDAILFGRGGYGFSRIIDYVNFKKFTANPKWLLGYSDITIAHNHIHRNLGIATIHAHMSGGYAADSFDNDSTMSIYHALTNSRSLHYTINTTTSSEESICRGALVGGNLSVFMDTIGTASEIDTDGKILVLEDIGEYRYKVDRMMNQLLRCGKLDKLAGLIIGGFTDSLDQTVPFGQNEYELIWDKVAHFNYPVCFGFPVGHQAKNVALKLGVEHDLIISKDKIELKEIVAEA